MTRKGNAHTYMLCTHSGAIPSVHVRSHACCCAHVSCVSISCHVGEVKLSDFGIAAHLPPEALADDGKVKEQKREAGKIAGSPHFMAPEALRGYPVHKLHDIWR